MGAELIVLRFIHIVGGIFWVGAMLFNSLFLFPALAKAGPTAAGPLMGEFQKRKAMLVLPGVALITILAGARLMWITSGGFQAGYAASGTGKALIVGAVAGIVSFLIGVLIGRPAAMRSGQLGAAMARTPEGPECAAMAHEMEALRRRTATSGMVVVVLLVIASGAMAVARYLG